MTRSCLFQALLCFSVLFLDCFSAENVLNSAKAGSFCIWTRSTSDGRTHYTFLQRTLETSQTSLVLYDSLWSGNNSLVSCITSNERSVIESYLSKCHSSSVSSFSETSDVPFNISELVEPGGPCRNAAITEGFTGSVRRARDLRGVDPDGSVDQDSRESSRLKLHRSKRAWMIPGTVWCGSGNKATNFTDLGVFEETDKCCREHDHCKDTIASFTFNHGMFNTNIFTLSHCDCDNRFRRCLLGVNDTMSNIVGYGYFNVLKMRCFEFSHRMQCAKRTWWGMCAFFEPTRFAVVKGPTNYTDTLWETDNNTLAISFHQTISAGENQATTSKASLIVQAKDSTGTGAELTTVTAPPGPSVTTLVARKTEPNVVPTDPPKTTPTQAKRDRQRKGKSEICGSYRDLDSCHLQIPALQEKFGLRNPDFRTLYHCNCTARLAQQISRPDDVDPVHSLLMDFVSQSCFTLTQSENCTEGSSCFTPPNAALMKRWTKDTTEERHLVDIKRRFKRINSKRSKRKDSPVKLYKKCLRMHTKLHRTPVHEQTLS